MLRLAKQSTFQSSEPRTFHSARPKARSHWF
jgi:hypothetical protein